LFYDELYSAVKSNIGLNKRAIALEFIELQMRSKQLEQTANLSKSESLLVFWLLFW